MNRLTSVKMFALEWAHITALRSAPRWGTLGVEMEGAIRKIVSMPSIMSLRFTNVTGLPMDLITSCPNLQHLTVRNIDDTTAPYIPPTADSAPQHEAEWRVKSITAIVCCQRLLDLRPVVEERLSIMYYDPVYLNNILKRSKDLKDLTIVLKG
ncbi:hypothetical protein BJ165DRAFT_573252 [Panaeolus papilionaceus]|nr:hypothetical protein BJ165DRAFT_573252 [Panaeolus papilionaceus]